MKHEPIDLLVLAAGDNLFVRFQSISRNVSHVLKHSRSMPRDDIGVPCCGATDLKGVGRGSLRWVGILMSAITVLLRILSFGLRLLWYLRFNLKRSTLNVQR